MSYGIWGRVGVQKGHVLVARMDSSMATGEDRIGIMCAEDGTDIIILPGLLVCYA